MLYSGVDASRPLDGAGDVYTVVSLTVFAFATASTCVGTRHENETKKNRSSREAGQSAAQATGDGGSIAAA